MASGVPIPDGLAEALLDYIFHVFGAFLVGGTGNLAGFEVTYLGLYSWNGGGEVEEGEKDVKEQVGVHVW